MSTPAMTTISNSSNIAAIGYDEPRKELHLKFHSGGHAIHSGVSRQDHAALMQAASKGSHYSAHIKGKYAHRRG